MVLRGRFDGSGGERSEGAFSVEGARGEKWGFDWGLGPYRVRLSGSGFYA